MSTSPEAWHISICQVNYICNIEVINNTIATQLFNKIRIVRSTYDMPAYIDLYYTGASEHTCYAMITDNLFRYEYASAGFKTVAFTAAEIPEGYTATEFDLVDINATT